MTAAMAKPRFYDRNMTEYYNDDRRPIYGLEGDKMMREMIVG